MAEQFDRTNTVSINLNDKDGVENRPDLKLDINIDGVRYFASAWKKQGRSGTFYSGPVEVADDKYQPNGAPVAASRSADDGIPF